MLKLSPSLRLLWVLCLSALNACGDGAVTVISEEIIEPGIVREKIKHLNAFGIEQEVWLYHPDPLPEQAPALVVIAPAGGNLITAPPLSEGDAPEHLPYVRAGHTVVSFSMMGELRESDTTEDVALFKLSSAGVADASSALDLALARMPFVDDEKIYAAGHSSAGTLALLFALEDERVKGVIAYAPVTDTISWANSEYVQAYSELDPEYPAFLKRSSPLARADEFDLPMFVFGIRHDNVVAWEDVLYFAGSVSDDASIFVSTSQGNSHYQSMIDDGIPKALTWLEVVMGKRPKSDLLKRK